MQGKRPNRNSHLKAEKQWTFKRAPAAGIEINSGQLKLPAFQKSSF
jgi:hypothetical protein